MPVIAFSDIEDVAQHVGMALAILTTGALVGPPISGAINKITGGFKLQAIMQVCVSMSKLTALNSYTKRQKNQQLYCGLPDNIYADYGNSGK
jgi:hypothetical protein